MEARINAIQELEPSQEHLNQEAALFLELNDWYEREETKWKQKSRELWLGDGDCNSKLFHLFTLVRRRRNLITEIHLENGHWIHGRGNIESYFTRKFTTLFQSSQLQIPTDLENLIAPSIFEIKNAELSRIPEAEEIKLVVWEMNPLKAPGPDGFSRIFFKHYWGTIGPQVVDVVHNFFREGQLLKKLNHTYITLIPKKLGACNFNHFRPISLCNFYYKIISKIMVNRLRPLLAKLIDPTQAAFVLHRWIAENVVLAQEIVHSFKKSKKKKGYMGLKLDFHKAYDCLEWNFIPAVLRASSFDQKFISLVFQCISIVNFTLLINGCKSSSFSPTRSIRQGDLLSPYLLILCIDVLARLIDREVARGALQGVKIAAGASSISSLFYADDAILFCGAKLGDMAVLMDCVNKFCEWSGQSISTDKSVFFVSKGVQTNSATKLSPYGASRSSLKVQITLAPPCFYPITDPKTSNLW